jgi:hypothetical protein
MFTAISNRLVPRAFLSAGSFRRLFPSPRRQTAVEHKRRSNGSKDCQLQIVGHAFLPFASQCRGSCL